MARLKSHFRRFQNFKCSKSIISQNVFYKILYFTTAKKKCQLAQLILNKFLLSFNISEYAQYTKYIVTHYALQSTIKVELRIIVCMCI